MKPLILVSNDDGISSRGIHELVDVALQFGDVVAVAPLEQHSGQSSAITVGKAIRFHEFDNYHGARMLGVSGTPVDCVKIALHTILQRKPDFMFSGINHGSNSGNCALYSGTVAAAMETTMAGVPSVAFSLLTHNPEADFTGARPFVEQLARQAVEGAVPHGVCLNVNIPANCDPVGVKVARAALGYWTDEYMEYRDPFGKPFFMLAGHFVNAEPEATDTDEYWLAQNYVSVVPVRPDQSALDLIPSLASRLGK